LSAASTGGSKGRPQWYRLVSTEMLCRVMLRERLRRLRIEEDLCTRDECVNIAKYSCVLLLRNLWNSWIRKRSWRI